MRNPDTTNNRHRRSGIFSAEQTRCLLRTFPGCFAWFALTQFLFEIFWFSLFFCWKNIVGACTADRRYIYMHICATICRFFGDLNTFQSKQLSGQPWFEIRNRHFNRDQTIQIIYSASPEPPYKEWLPLGMCIQRVTTFGCLYTKIYQLWLCVSNELLKCLWVCVSKSLKNAIGQVYPEALSASLMMPPCHLLSGLLAEFR